MWRQLFLGSGLLVITVGCHTVAFTGSTALNAPLPATLSGVVVSNAAETEFYLADMREIMIQGVDLAIPLNAGDWVETNQIVKVDVFKVYQGKTYDYHAVIGPPPSGGPAYWRFNNSEPTIVVGKGWAFLWGLNVRTGTHWVTAGSSWTTIAIEVVSSTLQRFHLIRGAKGWVTCGANTQDITAEEHYVTIDSSCNISTPIPIAGDPIVEPLIKLMKDAAREAGWNEE